MNQTVTYTSYAQDVDRVELPGLLMGLSKKYFGQLGGSLESSQDIEKSTINKLTVYQCSSCLTIYNEAMGDEKNGISIGTPFDKLSDANVCPVCESSKANFVTSTMQVEQT